MKKCSLICAAIIFLYFSGYAQNDTIPSMLAPVKKPVYKLKPAVDIPIIAAGTGWSLYAFTKIYVKDPSTEAKILSLKKEDVNAFDRWGMYPYSKSLDQVSYYPFYAAMPLPLVYFALDKETRPDFLKLSFLYWEAMAITGLFGTGATYFVDKYRPYAYSNETPMAKRTDGLAKNSFYAGHVQVVAVPTFLIAKVYADYHPESNLKWVYYGVAAAATGVTAYMRLAGGQHFPSDVLLGTAMGTLTGILVPQFHKNRVIKDKNMSIVPSFDGEIYGFALRYDLN